MADNLIEKLSQMFLKFPGIGPRQARRFVYFLLQQDKANLNRLSETIKNLKDSVGQCSNCFRFFINYADQDNSICEICLDPDRHKTQVMVVEKDIDVETIRRSDAYRGYFFILGGLTPILEKKPEQKIRLKELINYLKTNRPAEVILALSVNPEGDHTVAYLKKELAPVLNKLGIKITGLGRGLSTGTELEYSDTETLNQAFKNRQ